MSPKIDENGTFQNMFKNSYQIYTELFQDNIVEDTYSVSKRKYFMKSKGDLKPKESVEY